MINLFGMSKDITDTCKLHEKVISDHITLSRVWRMLTLECSLGMMLGWLKESGTATTCVASLGPDWLKQQSYAFKQCFAH
eukprot:15003291-Heterocapsa_arctica.AAC.1